MDFTLKIHDEYDELNEFNTSNYNWTKILYGVNYVIEFEFN